MNSAVYEAVSYAMRYWFLLVVVGILIAVIYISVKEYREKKLLKGEISQYFGYLEIIDGPEEFVGDRFGVRNQNTIGSSKNSDIILPDETVEKNHALLYIDDDNLILTPYDMADTRINDRRATTSHMLKTGDIISIGDVDFYVYIKRTRVNHDI